MALTITSISPVSGRRGQSTSITIRGEEFSAGIEVLIGNEPATAILVDSGTQITCTTPIDLEVGKYDISVRTSEDSAKLENSFVVFRTFPQYPYLGQDFNTIQTRVLERMPDNYDITEGSVTFDIFAPMSLELADTYLSMRNHQALVFVLTAVGAYLDFKGIEYNVIRRDGTPAIGQVTFQSNRDITIPKGTAVSNLVTEVDVEPVVFLTDEDLILAQNVAGTVGVTAVLVEDEVRSLRFGRRTNLEANAIQRIVNPITGVSIVSSTQTRGGSDTEEDEPYRSRILAEILTPSGSGNIRDYIRWAGEASPYVGFVGVDPIHTDRNRNGDYVLGILMTAIDDSETDIVFTEDVELRLNDIISIDDENMLIEDGSGANYSVVRGVGTTLAAQHVVNSDIKLRSPSNGEVGVYIMNVDGGEPQQELIDTVQVYIGPDQLGKGEAPIGALPLIGIPNFVDVNVTVKVTLFPGFILAGTIHDEIQANIEEYINGLGVGDSLQYHTLGTVISTTNGVLAIRDYFISTENAPPVQNEIADITIQNHQKARASASITITE